ncbi:peptide/nickel transport system substrate-binding protein [Sporobacter termitidis DSM 10068]|uniref:Peptide/nickel transport system substrate-binding protein n=1 Tax=Sporobacter termitidis DSM 10068 TaxID=1123282 RepID=A0A1M5XSY7_9FIRM|nr:ABC transporter substrate-binding protein [Sporobacter termitidis]SHI02869.1 peptide/nickel transport system substrate-binding protein [Sporobacter termitidis DSM 10068]
MKKAVSILLALTLAFSLLACGQKTNTAAGESSPSASAGGAQTPVPAAPQYGGTLRMVTPAEGAAPIGLPWKIAPSDVWLTWPFLETLLKQQLDGTCTPLLAESYDIDTAGNTITFKLRQGVKFHDGSDFNAEVAKWNIDMIHDNSASKPTYDNVTVVSPYEVSIHYPDGINNSSSAGWATTGSVMISMEAYKKNGEEWTAEHPVGTGPFKFIEYVKGASVKGEKFDGYWQKEYPYLDSVELVMIKDVMTQNIALQSTGDQSIDILNTNNGDQIQNLTNQGFAVQSIPLGPIGFLPSSDDPSSPFAKPEVRQALSYAIDRDAICNARGFGVWKPAYQINAEGYGGHSEDPAFGVPRYDPVKAKALLAQAGYPDGFKTTLYGQPGMADKDAVVAMQSMLAAVGITAEVSFPDSGGYSDLRGNGWDGILVQSNRNLPVMETVYTLLYDNKRNYFKSIQHPQELQELVEKATNKLGQNDAELLDLQKYILDNALFVPLYFTYDTYIYKPTVQNFKNTGSSSGNLFEIWLSQK